MQRSEEKFVFRSRAQGQQVAAEEIVERRVFWEEVVEWNDEFRGGLRERERGGNGY